MQVEQGEVEGFRGTLIARCRTGTANNAKNDPVEQVISLAAGLAEDNHLVPCNNYVNDCTLHVNNQLVPCRV